LGLPCRVITTSSPAKALSIKLDRLFRVVATLYLAMSASFQSSITAIISKNVHNFPCCEQVCFSHEIVPLFQIDHTVTQWKAAMPRLLMTTG
jgi:hypothetical protein